MNAYRKIIKDHFTEPTIRYDHTDLTSLSEMLWDSYTSLNPVDSALIRKHYLNLNPIFESLPISDSNTLFATVCALCEEYERAAFLEGLRVGALLLLELTEAHP